MCIRDSPGSAGSAVGLGAAPVRGAGGRLRRIAVSGAGGSGKGRCGVNLRYCLCGIAVLAVVTYIPRALPLSVLRRQVKSRFLQAFLFYMPYAVLGAMTFPAILYSTSSIWSAAAGMAVALVFSLSLIHS